MSEESVSDGNRSITIGGDMGDQSVVISGDKNVVISKLRQSTPASGEVAEVTAELARLRELLETLPITPTLHAPFYSTSAPGM